MEARKAVENSSGAMRIMRLGLRPYNEVWMLQKKILAGLIGGNESEALIFCQHLPVITYGTSGHDENLLASRESLLQQGVELYQVERGGDMTYHGPGQLVLYPLLNLRHRRMDVGWYMRGLEQVMIDVLREFGISAFAVAGKTGVWTAFTEGGQASTGRKIGSLGVRISRWCTMHGLALNVQDSSNGFALINPCGFRSISMSSMEQEAGHRFRIEAVQEVMLQKFLAVF